MNGASKLDFQIQVSTEQLRKVSVETGRAVERSARLESSSKQGTCSSSLRRSVQEVVGSNHDWLFIEWRRVNYARRTLILVDIIEVKIALQLSVDTIEVVL